MEDLDWSTVFQIDLERGGVPVRRLQQPYRPCAFLVLVKLVKRPGRAPVPYTI